MPLFTIDESKCARDGICAAECPVSVIDFKGSGSLPVPARGAGRICINCGHCVAVCPHGAFSLATMSADDCPGVDESLLLTPEQAEHFVRTRRSIRRYLDQPVRRADVEGLLRVVRYAPSGSNSQQVGWVVVQSRPEVKRMASMVIDWMRDMVAKGQPAMGPYRLENIIGAFESGYDIICRGAPAMLVAHAPETPGSVGSDCTIALTHADLVAPTLGLGTCWAGFFMFAARSWPPLREALQIPAGHAPYGALMLGYPEFQYYRLPLRKEPKITWLG